MGIMDKLKDMLGQHQDKAGQASDAAERKINERTGGKYEDKVDQGQQQVEDRLGMRDRRDQPPT
ncbi:antitoxin [Streptomyces purpureus]|uniref:Kanamycin biosynthetic protein n=1 Tax=Streptomyces purpureus TaxID=1951 RepID=A0A918LPI9_9ACTN|nr:antitoxin [Streptomyces purpureus]GGT34881.1 hypothetical protein GCM10014713_30680 [Streptomyces purpureus]